MVLQALRNFAPRDPPLLVQVAKLEAMLSSGLAERELADAENLEVIESLRAELEAATAKSEGRGVEVNRLSSQITGLTAALNSSLAEADSKAGSLAELRAAMQEIEVKEEEAREFCAKLERKVRSLSVAVRSAGKSFATSDAGRRWIAASWRGCHDGRGGGW